MVKLGGLRINSRHWSLDNNYYEEVDTWDGERVSNSGYAIERFTLGCPQFGLTFKKWNKPIVHDVELDTKYYSITHMLGDGHIYPDKKVEAEAWFDHQWGEGRDLKSWEWVGLKLNCGLSAVCGSGVLGQYRFCDVSIGDVVIRSNFILEAKHFFISSLGMYLTLEPVCEEKIFDPKVGIKYSEQPFEVISKGSVIGYGMRERTYYKEEIIIATTK